MCQDPFPCLLGIDLPSLESVAAFCPFLLWTCPGGSQLIPSLLVLGKFGPSREKEEAASPCGEKHLLCVPFVQAWLTP